MIIAQINEFRAVADSQVAGALFTYGAIPVCRVSGLHRVLQIPFIHNFLIPRS